MDMRLARRLADYALAHTIEALLKVAHKTGRGLVYWRGGERVVDVEPVL
jgi:hypothetical protein